MLVAILAASVAFAGPAEAASKHRKKHVSQRAKVSAVQARAAGASHDVYVGGELVGRDPDPFIRSMMMRNPHIWDGPE
jgi:hypothetical protein